ncbi:Acg family FMN-binding oxidoreductase [Planomonospora corallina]|uniref:Acg family FMN-binding oxidoreductase n=1 Tax=Planomonospora corallina TaxID=1806052 RepID=A0ABV8IGH4_9ACTN
MLNPLSTHAGVRRLVTAAGAAPSVLNTQPWRFNVRRREHIELHADPDRRLPATDPRGRSLHISCGAALFNLRLAMRVAGWRPVSWPLPASDGSTLLAAVRPVEASLASPAEHELYGAIKERRTNRHPFSDERLPAQVMEELVRAVRIEGAELVPVGGPASASLLDEVAMADERLASDPEYRAELTHWTGGGGLHCDGVPPYVQGPRPVGDTVPVRSFTWVARETARFETHPQLVVVTTSGDGPQDWLRAGQALQRMLLTATLYGVSASFLNQPLDLRDMRGHTDPRHHRGHPQMIVRLGYGPAVPRAPRRPAPEILSAA